MIAVINSLTTIPWMYLAGIFFFVTAAAAAGLYRLAARGDEERAHAILAEEDRDKLREALDWIEAEPEDPAKVQARARAALTGGTDTRRVCSECSRNEDYLMEDCSWICHACGHVTFAGEEA